MKRTAITLVMLASAMIMAGTESAAALENGGKPIVSVSPYLGYGVWSKDLGLDDDFVLGARGAVHFLKWLSLEGTYGRFETDRERDGVIVGLDHFGVDLVAELLPRAKFVPYITAGWAQLNYRAAGTNRKLPLNGAEVGVGVKTLLGGHPANYRALRLDVRDVMSNLNPDFPNDDATTHSIVTTLGIQFAFGKGSKDSDNDGIGDRDDGCPHTPAGAIIDAAGCPIDSDGDGVFDGLDKCDGTPTGATVSADGCPVDSDGDGVFDGLDKCDGTPVRVTVSADGCPVDSDGDGVFDGLDKCPGTLASARVDAYGCPLPGPPVMSETLVIKTIGTPILNFDVDSGFLGRNNVAKLEFIGRLLADWPDLMVEIGGHTDNTGSPAYNQRLSQERALSVKEHLRAQHSEIHEFQIIAVGYGPYIPIADNNTQAGRAANRRVEIKVLNTEDLEREVLSR